MTTHLISFVCQVCGMEVSAYIDRKGALFFSIRDKLYSPKDMLSDLGYFVCFDCDNKSDVRFRIFK